MSLLKVFALGTLLGVVSLTGPLQSPGQTAEPPRTDPVFRLLASEDPARVERGLEDLRKRLSLDGGTSPEGQRPIDGQLRGHTVQTIRFEWLPRLIKRERHDAAAEVALLAIQASHGTNMNLLDHLARTRAEALRDAGRHSEALAAAKSYYNVCRVWSTPAAVELVATTLDAAHPDQPGIGHRFKLRQLDAVDTPDGTPAPTTELSAIGVDPEPYYAILNTIGGQGFLANFRRGNLLLLADRPQEARREFERALELAASEQGLGGRDPAEAAGWATEGIARAIRATDHGMGRAGPFLASSRVTVKDDF